MSFGYERVGRIFLNDSKVLQAFLYSLDDQTLVPQADIDSVDFTVLKPSDDPALPTVDAQAGTVIADGTGQYVVAGTVNDEEGEYRAYATFTYDDGTLTGLTKTVPVFYDVIDAFERTGPHVSDPYVDQAWLKLEDCFDSEFGGPWLRDMTMRVFDKTKMRALAPEVLLAVNQQMPFTDYTIDSFPYDGVDAGALFAQGLLVSTIRHLMRSYTEQPDVMSSPVAFMDRKRYQQAWKAQYDVEQQLFERWLNRWKLRSYDLTHASVLLGTKAGRMLPAPMRSRNVGRGF
jgi:hypothetical protein